MLMTRRPCANESIVSEENFPMTTSGYSVSQTTVVRLWAAKFFIGLGLKVRYVNLLRSETLKRISTSGNGGTTRKSAGGKNVQLEL